MSEQNEQQTNLEQKPIVPVWYENYAEKLIKTKKDLKQEKEYVEKLSIEGLTGYIGGSIEELPYEVLQVILPEGSDDRLVAEVLRNKRTNFLKQHPEMVQAKGSSEGVIAFDGRFIPKSDWDTATDSEKRGVLVGSTCFHYNSDTPGMGSSSKDRF